MAAPTSASSSRASAKRAQRRAKRSESLSGSMRQFLTPEVWKQVKQVAAIPGHSGLTPPGPPILTVTGGFVTIGTC